MVKPKSDCFAYVLREDGINCECSALQIMECKTGEGRCSFYKPLKQQLDELQQNNNTISVEVAIKAYTKYASQKAKSGGEVDG